MILGDFLKALGQIGDSRILRVMALGVLMALGLKKPDSNNRC